MSYWSEVVGCAVDSLQVGKSIEIKVNDNGKKILDAVHETAAGLHEAGVMNTRTMREFDLPPVKRLTLALIKRLRTTAVP